MFLSTLRFCRKTGNGRGIWPKGIDSAEDLPYDLVKVLERATRILDVEENLPSDDAPPTWMWLADDELEIWFNNLHKKRKEASGSIGDEDEEPELLENELAKDFRK